MYTLSQHMIVKEKKKKEKDPPFSARTPAHAQGRPQRWRAPHFRLHIYRVFMENISYQLKYYIIPVVIG